MQSDAVMFDQNRSWWQLITLDQLRDRFRLASIRGFAVE